MADQLQQSPVYRFDVRARSAYTWEQVYRQSIAPLLEQVMSRPPPCGGKEDSLDENTDARTNFVPLATALVPVLNGCDVTSAVAAACAIAEQVILVGLVTASPERGLSANTKEARALRERMRELATQSRIVRHSEVLVGVEPWLDLVRYIATHTPDLLVMDLGQPTSSAWT